VADSEDIWVVSKVLALSESVWLQSEVQVLVDTCCTQPLISQKLVDTLGLAKKPLAVPKCFSTAKGKLNCDEKARLLLKGSHGDVELEPCVIEGAAVPILIPGALVEEWHLDATGGEVLIRGQRVKVHWQGSLLKVELDPACLETLWVDQCQLWSEDGPSAQGDQKRALTTIERDMIREGHLGGCHPSHARLALTLSLETGKKYTVPQVAEAVGEYIGRRWGRGSFRSP